MAEIDASYMTESQKRAALVNGDTIYFPWGNRNRKSMDRMVSDLKGPATIKVWYRLNIFPGNENAGDSEAMNQMFVYPGQGPQGWYTPEQAGFRPDTPLPQG